MNTHEISDNTENFIVVKEIGKNKKTKLNHRQDHRIPLRNSFEILPIEECQDKPKPTDEENSMLPSFYHAPSKRRQKKQSTKHSKQPEAYVTNYQYEIGRRTHSEATKFGKKICVISNITKIE